MVFFYLSGHGFGHASRQIEVINALGSRAPGIGIAVRTSAPRWLFDRTVRVPFTLEAIETDTGVVQVDSLHLDERRTIECAARFYQTFEARVAAERDLLRGRGARLVVGDAPPLAFAAAAAAGIPGIVIANFTWDWIYEGYPEHLHRAPQLVPAIAAAYRSATVAWRLPMHGGFANCAIVQDIPFIARHARHDPAHVRAVLKLPPDRVLVLASFGGIGVRSLDTSRLDCLEEFELVLTHRQQDEGALPSGVHAVDESALYDSGLRYEDLVAAVDVVVTKPGYGIISECIANNTALLYTSRGRFSEYDVLVSAMPRYLRCGFIDHEALFSGRWRSPLRALAALPPPAQVPVTNGAEIAAERMLHFLQ